MEAGTIIKLRRAQQVLLGSFWDIQKKIILPKESSGRIINNLHKKYLCSFSVDGHTYQLLLSEKDLVIM